MLSFSRLSWTASTSLEIVSAETSGGYDTTIALLVSPSVVAAEVCFAILFSAG